MGTKSKVLKDLSFVFFPACFQTNRNHVAQSTLRKNLRAANEKLETTLLIGFFWSSPYKV